MTAILASSVVPEDTEVEDDTLEEEDSTRASTIPNITLFHYFRPVPGGMIVKKHGLFGPGKFVPLEPLAIPNLYTFKTVPIQPIGPPLAMHQRNFENQPLEGQSHPIRRSLMRLYNDGELEEVNSVGLDRSDSYDAKHDDYLEDAEDEDEPALFLCPTDSCIAVFLRHHNLLKHIESGKHVMQKESVSSLVRMQRLWHDAYNIPKDEQPENYKKGRTLRRNLTELNSIQLPPSYPSSGDFSIDFATRGWALKGKRTNKRHSDRALEYVREQFDLGAKTGATMKPRAVSLAMKTLKLPDGRQAFAPEERLSEVQVKAQFSKLAKEAKRPAPCSEDSSTDDAEFHEMNQMISSAMSSVISAVALQRLADE